MKDRILRGAVAAVALAGAFGACSSSGGDEKTKTTEPVPEGGITVVPKVDSGPSPTVDASADTGTEPLGPLKVIDLADIDCEQAVGQASEVTPADPSGPLFDQLGTVGGRRFAVSSDGLQFFTFGTPGSPSSPVDNVIGAAGEGSLVAGLVKTGGGISLQRFDADGNLSGSAISLTTNNDWQTVVAGPGKTLVVWSRGAAMEGRLLDPGGGVTATVDLGADTAGAGTYALGVVPSGTGFLLTWTRNRSDKKLETLWRRVEADGTTSTPRSLVLSSGDHLMVGLTALANGGAAILLNEGLPSRDVVVVRLDAQGAVIEPGVRMLGSGRGFGIAAHGDEIAVLATKGNRSAFRALGTDNAALSPWRCLDDADGGSSFYPQAAIDRDDGGYAHLTRVENGASIFRRVDNVGVGF